MFRSMLCSVSLIALCSASAFASGGARYPDGFFFAPSVGVEYQYSHYGNQSSDALGAATDDIVDTSLHGGNLHAGARIHKHMGVEASYFQTEEGHKNDVLGLGVNTALQVHGVALDVLGYYPMAQEFELIGTVGASYAEAEVEYSGALVESESYDEVKARVGAGFQYWLTDQLNSRVLVRYQAADFEDSVDNAVIATVGVNYQF